MEKLALGLNLVAALYVILFFATGRLMQFFERQRTFNILLSSRNFIENVK